MLVRPSIRAYVKLIADVCDLPNDNNRSDIYELLLVLAGVHLSAEKARRYTYFRASARDKAEPS